MDPNVAYKHATSALDKLLLPLPRLLHPTCLYAQEDTSASICGAFRAARGGAGGGGAHRARITGGRENCGEWQWLKAAFPVVARLLAQPHSFRWVGGIIASSKVFTAASMRRRRQPAAIPVDWLAQECRS